MGHQPPIAWEFPLVIGTHLLDPKEVLADETLLRDSARPSLFRSPEFTENRHAMGPDTSRPVCVIATLPLLDDRKL
jgi:hypothetical protein